MVVSRLIRSGLLAIAVLIAPTFVAAVTVDDLFETSQPVAGSQDAAFVEALKTVVIRVSGRRDAPDRLGPALGNARQYVQRYGVTQENVLQVGFDDVSIERLLTDAGLPIWGRERPATLVVLNLDDFGGGWLSADLPPADKERIAAAAQERGLPLEWGMLDAADQNILTMGEGAAASLVQIARRNGANAILVGRGTRSGVLRWILASDEGTTQLTGSYEDAIHSSADYFAKLFAAEGTSLTRIKLEVSGISDLDAYASTLNYLEGMTLVRGVAVEQVSGDTMLFQLAVRGDASTLQRAIALDRRLVPQTTPASAAGLAFRYQK